MMTRNRAILFSIVYANLVLILGLLVATSFDIVSIKVLLPAWGIATMNYAVATALALWLVAGEGTTRLGRYGFASLIRLAVVMGIIVVAILSKQNWSIPFVVCLLIGHGCYLPQEVWLLHKANREKKRL